MSEKTTNEYRISHRFIFKNGKVGDWTMWVSVWDIEWNLHYWSEHAKEFGRKVEFRLQSRLVTEWKDAGMIAAKESNDANA